MASAIRLSMLALDLFAAADSLVRAAEAPEDTKWLRQAAAVNRLAILGLKSVEAFMIVGGANAESLGKLKQIELIPRTLNIPMQFTLEVDDAANLSTARAVIRVVERGILAPVAGAVVTAGEAAYYYEKQFLDMTPSELLKAKRPVYQYSKESDTLEIKEYKPIDLEECRTNLANAEKAISIGAGIRVGSEASLIEKTTLDLIAPFYQYLARYLIAMNARQNPRQEPQMQDPGDAALNLNFLQYDKIPYPLHGDAVFRQHICPITVEPIRDPVMDPNRQTIYERSAIVRWLGVNRTSPVTRQPMRQEDLIEVPAVRALIDARLRQHQGRLMEVLEQGLEIPMAVVQPNVN